MLVCAATPASCLVVSPLERRAVLWLGAAALGSSFQRPACADQRGAEDAYKTQPFGNEVCLRRTPLGACAEVGAPQRAADVQLNQLKVEDREGVSFDGLPETDYVRMLKQRTEDNAEANAREVLEKTVKSAMPGTYGPFAKVTPVMRPDGTFDDVKLATFDQLKDNGFITVTKTGLNAYSEKYDLKRPLEEQLPRKGFFGLF